MFFAMTAEAISAPSGGWAGPRGAWGAAGVLALLAVAGVWSVDYLPTHDGPQHVFTVHAASRLAEPASGYGRFLEPGHPLTNHGFALVFGPADRWLPWRTALRIALTVLVLAWSAGAMLLARAVHPGRLWLGVALAAGAFQWSLYMGLFSFHLATSLGLLTLAFALAISEPARHQRGSTAAKAALSGMLLLVALAHVAAGVLTAALFAAVALARAQPGQRLRALASAAFVCAPVLAIAAALLLVGLAGLQQAHAGPDAWSHRATPLWALARGFFAGPLWRAWPPTLLAAAAPLCVLALRRSGGALRDADRALLSGGALLLFAAALAPLHLPAWDFFSLRLLPLGVCCLCLSLPFERLPGAARKLAAASIAGFALASSLWALDYNRDLAARAADALAGLDAELPRSGARLPIVLDPYLGRPLDDSQALVPYAVPLLNLGQLYATAQGGFAPFTFAHSPWLHPVVWRDAARRRFPHVVDRRYAIDLAKPAFRQDANLRRAVATYLAGIGAHYQDVILWGRPDDAELLESLGFVADFRRGGLLLARFRGCPLTVTFPGNALPPDDTRIELGWLPAWHVTHRYRVERRPVVPLENPPCGGAWLRLASASAPEAGLRCEGADEQGRLLIPSTRATPVVECRLRPPA